MIRKNISIIIFYIMSFGFNVFSLKKKNIVWEVNGLSLERYKQHKFFFIIYVFLRLLQKFCLRGSLVYVVSPTIKEDLIDGFFSCNEEDVIVIENGAPKIADSTIDSRTPISEKICIVFYGVLRNYNEYQIVAQALREICERSGLAIDFHIVGYGPCEQEVQEIENLFDNIYVWGKLTPDELRNKSFFSAKVYGVIPLKATFQSKFLSPIKLYEYCSFGFPVFISDVFEGERDQNCIFSYRAGSVSSLVEVMRYVFFNDYNFQMSKAYSFAKSNSWRVRMKNLTEVIERRGLSSD
jgi:glycosyltransferase involved in cell wall biosynthesis